MKKNETPPAAPKKRPGIEVELIAAFAACLASRGSLRETIKKAEGLGYDRPRLIELAVEAGYSESHASSTVSSVLLELHPMEKAAGKRGAKVPKEAKDLAGTVLADHDGDRKEAARILLAAYRFVKASKK